MNSNVAAQRRRRGLRTVTFVAVGIAVLLTALTTTTASARVTSIVARSSEDGCTPFELIEVPGTTEGTANPDTPTGLLAPVAQELQKRFGSKIRTFTTPYRAVAFTDGMTYADSERQGVDLTNREVDRVANQCPNTRIGIIGYSQGADVAGDVACAIGTGAGAISPDNIVGVGLVSDPHHGTPGATDIGPATGKQGIMGPRQQCAGFGNLNGRVATICVDGDLYCGVDNQRDPLLTGIADVLGNASLGGAGQTTADGSGPSAGTPGAQQLAQSLTSDFSRSDLSALPTDLAGIVDAARSGDGATVARLASKVGDTLAPLADIITNAAGNPGFESVLKNGDAGSPEAVSSAVLDTAKTLDVGKAVSAANKLATTALASTGNGAHAPSNSSSGSPSDTGGASMGDSAAALAQQVAPLTATPADQLATAARVFATVKPAVWVNQVTNIASGTLSMATNLPKVLEAFGRIGPILLDPTTDIWGKIHQLHEVADELNRLFEPVVKMAAAVDLHTAANLIGMIPDPNGVAAIVSTVVGILANVDVIGVANEVGRIQTTAWNVLESCKTGCNLQLATPLIDSGLKLATLALGALGGGAKTPPDQLGKQPVPAAGTLPDAAARLAGADNGEAIGKLLQQGLDAASFYGSGAHTSYGGFVVDRSGRNTIQYLTDWMTQQFNKALGA